MHRHDLGLNLPKELKKLKGYTKNDILRMHWTENEDSLYEIDICHNLGSKDLFVSGYRSDNNISLFLSWKIIDENNIKVYSDRPVNASISVFHSSNILNTNVEIENGSIVTINDKLDAINNLYSSRKIESTFIKKVELDTKSDVGHTHEKSEITDFPESLPADGGNADSVGGLSLDDTKSGEDIYVNNALWSANKIKGHLDEKSDVGHTHEKSEITDFPESLPADGGNADSVGGLYVNDFVSGEDAEENNAIWTANKIKTDLEEKSDVGHTHTKSEITDFPESLPANGGNADTVDGYHVSDLISGEEEGNNALWSANKIKGHLNEKSNVGHKHTKSEITDFPTHLPADGGNSDTVDGYHVNDSDEGTVQGNKALWSANKIKGHLDQKSNSNHRHTKSEITDFPTHLPANGGNADTVDGYHVNDSDDGTAQGNKALWSANKIKGHLDQKSNTNHTHDRSQITNFPQSLPANGGNADTVDGKHANSTPVTLEKNDLVGMVNEVYHHVNNTKTQTQEYIDTKDTEIKSMMDAYQLIQAEAKAELVRDTIPSGFTVLGELDYEYMLSNENMVKLKTESVAYVNGYKVLIPAGTTVDIGKAPEKESREDLLFLEAWKSLDFAKSGKLSWRIRHVEDFDFEKKWVQANEGPDKYIGLNSDGSVFAKLIPQGGRTEPLEHCGWSMVYQNRCSTNHITQSGMINPTYGDPGLWSYFMGGEETNVFIDKMKTVDGFAYAIPMFRLYRKPSCGKLIPFEYSKINPKVDYSKFSKLVKEEKVERVISESIQGFSLVNKGLYKDYKSENIIAYANNLKANTLYTLIFKVKNKVNEIRHLSAEVQNAWVFFMNRITLNPYESRTVKKISVTLTEDQVKNSVIWIIKNSSNENRSQTDVEITDFIFLEGDWTEKEVPDYFEGLKSLGEEEGNLITIKNGILSDDTYDINDGKQKLSTFSDTTWVISENLITPQIEAVVKKNEQTTSVDKLNTLLETDGTETVDFTKIKGRTIQNYYPELVQSSFSTLNGKIEDGYIVLEGTGNSFVNSFIKLDKCLLKPNTKYTMVVYVVENTLVQYLALVSNHSDDVFNSTANGTFLSLPGKSKGVFKLLVTTVSQINNNMYGLRSYINSTETGKVKFKVMLLEGDHTNTPDEELQFVSGIKSVGENELLENGKYCVQIESSRKNFCPYKDITLRSSTSSWYDVKGKPSIHKPTVSSRTDTWFYLPSGYVKMTFKSFGVNTIQLIDKDEIILGYGGYNKFKGGFVCIRMYVNADTKFGFSDMMVEVSDAPITTNNSYSPYEKTNQNIYLKEPLRSLPNGVCDELIGSKVIRKVGERTFTGASSENWVEISGRHLSNTLFFEIAQVYKSDRSIRCDSFPTKLNGDSASVWTTDTEVCNFDDFWNVLVIRINRTKLSSPDLKGFKTWLSKNPVTVLYRLVTPEEEYLENVYEKESIKTYQLDAPLRSVLGGVKDEIKDNVLIRRCGEIRLDGSILPNNYSTHANGDTYTRFRIPIPGLANSGTSSTIRDNCVGLCDKLPQLGATPRGGTVPSTAEGIYNGAAYYNSTPVCYISIANSKIVNGGIKEWLRVNPIKIIYELDTPVEIPLIEATPQASNFSFHRQFSEGNWLRELPNRVKDTVENGQVIRRVGKKLITGSDTENWRQLSDVPPNPNLVIFAGTNIVHHSTNEHVKNILSNVLPSIKNGSVTTEGIVNGITNTYAPIVFINKSRLSTVDVKGFKKWLSENPMNVLYELNTPQVETITSDNYMYYPRHDFNTFCGNMYVGNGRNNFSIENKMKSDNPVVIETDFRKIECRSRIDDSKYKKCDDGYVMSYPSSSSINLLDTSIENGTLSYSDVYYTVVNNGFKIHNTSNGAYANVSFKVFLKTNVTYRIDFNKSGGGFVDFKTSSYSYIRNLDSGSTFTVTQTGFYYIIFYCTGQNATTGSETFTDVRLTEGHNLVSYTPFIKTRKYFENTEENDIEDLRHQVSLTGFNYDKILNESFDKLIRGEL